MKKQICAIAASIISLLGVWADDSYGPFGTNADVHSDPVTPTMFEDVELTINGAAMVAGDCVALYREPREGDPDNSDSVLCGLGKVTSYNETLNLTISIFVTGGTKVHFKVWRAAEDKVYDCDESCDYKLPTTPGNGIIRGLVLTVTAPLATYAVTYSPGTSGTGAQQTDTKTQDVALVLKGAIFTRTGYTQTGWATSDGGAKVYDLGVSYAANADVTLYPVWNANAYTIIYVPGGNGTGTQQTDTKTQDIALALKGAIFTRTGYTQTGWATSDGGAKVYDLEASYTANADITLYPVWKANTYTIIYVPGGNGTGTQQTDVKTQDIALALKGAIFTRTGYTQTGWAIIDGGTRDYDLDASYTANADITLYPVWKANTYTITYLPGDNGTGSQQTDTKTQDVALTLKGAIFTRAGYTQVGWVTSDGAKAYDLGASYSANAAVTLYPAWRVNDDPPRPTDTVNEPWTATHAETLNGALYDGDGNVCGTVQIKVAKPNERKGTVRVSGSVTPISGKKVTLKAVTVPVPPDTPIKASVNAKALGTLEVAIGDDGFEGTLGSWKVRKANVGGKWTRGDAKVYVDFDGGGALPVGTQTGFLPDGEPVIPKNGKWAFAKATQVKWAKNKTTGLKGLSVNVDKGKTNRSGLKLTYTPKTGVFKGSFKIYSVVDGNLKRHTVKVNGVVVDGEGTGLATLNNSGGWAVLVGTNGAATGTEDEPEVIGPFDTDKVTTLPGDDPIVSTDGKVSTADFKTWITGIAVVGSFDEYLAADPAKLSYVSPKNAISVYYGQVVVIRIVYDYPTNYLGYVWVEDEWPDGLPAGWTYPFAYGGMQPCRGRGVAYGHISFNANYMSCTLQQLSVRAMAEPMPDGFPCFESDGTVYPAGWRSSVTPVNIQFR